MDCKLCRSLMHAYFDGDLTTEQKQQLDRHLNTCASCRHHFRELDKTTQYLLADQAIAAPPDFTVKLRKQLPVSPKRPTVLGDWGKLLRRHPVLVAATIFFVLMSASFFSVWNQPGDFSLTTAPDNLNAIVIDPETHAVQVPAGEVVEGDLIVRSGSVEVYGEVTGNVVTVNGEVILASTADIYGKHEEIDQALDWIWFEARQVFHDIFHLGDAGKRETVK